MTRPKDDDAWARTLRAAMVEDEAKTDALSKAIAAGDAEAVGSTLELSDLEAHAVLRSARASVAVSDEALLARMPPARLTWFQRVWSDGHQSLPRWSVAALSGLLAAGVAAAATLMGGSGHRASASIAATSFRYVGDGTQPLTRGPRAVEIDVTARCALAGDVLVTVRPPEGPTARYAKPLRSTADDATTGTVRLDIPEATGADVTIEALCTTLPSGAAAPDWRPVFHAAVPPRRR